MAESKAQIASLDGMKKRERRKVLKRMTREVMRDKRYCRAIRKNPEPISKKAAQAAAGAAVDAVLGVHTGKPAVPPKKTGLEIYADIVHALTGAHKSTARSARNCSKSRASMPRPAILCWANWSQPRRQS